MFPVFLMSCLCYLATVSGGVAPFIKPCKLNDKACLIKSSQEAIQTVAAGIPEYGVDPTDPLRLDTVNADTEELKLTFNDLQVVGPSKCKFINVTVPEDQSGLSFEVDCPIVATGKYIAGGKVLFIPIEGDGNFKINTELIKLFVHAKLSTMDGSDGQKHWHIDSIDYTYDPVERIYIKLDNLFNGDEERAKHIVAILEASWKELIFQLGKPIISALIEKARVSIDHLLAAVPLNELYVA